ncbi:MAG: BtpA protein [Phycisphaerae bacterium]|nr:MAG: BtpA protein [Phycisphaerae bacterium]
MLPDRALIGMIHVGALPGTPHARKPIEALVAAAAADARVLALAGFDALLIENMHDRPYVNRHGPETTACMTRLALAVRQAVPDRPLGVQVLSAGHAEALAVAHAVGADFIRVENFVFAHVADEGLMPDAVAGPLLRYRRQIGAQRVRIFADIKKKHASHALTADVSIADAAHAAEFFGADGLIVTGAFTGRPADADDLAAVRAASKLPLWVGSGVTPANLAETFRHADAAIVGSSIKRGGVWSNPVDPARAKALVRARSRRS